MKRKNENVQGGMSNGQSLELGGALLKAIPRDMSADVAQGWIMNPKALEKALREALLPLGKKVLPLNCKALISEWHDFYRRHFGGSCNYSNIRIPEKPEGDWRLLIIEGLLLEQLYAKCKELFPCWRWTDENLDKKVTWNERDAKNGAYAIWVKDVQEADENLKNLSADDIKAKGIKTETVAERMIHEIKFFDESGGKHLDRENVTLCAGSRYDDGYVPHVRWDGDKMRLSWYNPDDARDHLRSREAVS